MNEFRGSIVIIGASAAGITAAKQIRKANAEAEVIVFTEEPHFPYFRPFLTEYLCETSVIQKDNFYLNPEKWYRDNRIDLRLAEKVTSIDPAAKTVSTAKGGSVAYEKLILANGSAPFVPKPELLQKENVFAIRTRKTSHLAIEWPLKSNSQIGCSIGLHDRSPGLHHIGRRNGTLDRHRLRHRNIRTE